MAFSNLEQKMENVVRTFEKTLDYDLALYTHNVSDKERELMEKDDVHMARLRYIEEEVKASIVTTLKKLSEKSTNDKVKLSATVELGKVVYRERFMPKDERQVSDVKVEVYMPENGRG